MLRRTYQTLYLFNRHYLFGWTLTRWLVVGFLFCPLLAFLGALSARSPWVLAGPIILLVLGGLGIIFLWKVKQAGFLHFEPEESQPQIDPLALPFPERVEVRASGIFKVNNAARYFVEQPAHYQTFHTRERVIMLNVPQTRYLLLTFSAEADVGWWYTFFTPKIIRKLEVGQLHFGREVRPALRLSYLPEEADSDETLYLSFKTEPERRAVLSDLYADDLRP